MPLQLPTSESSSDDSSSATPRDLEAAAAAAAAYGNGPPAESKHAPSNSHRKPPQLNHTPAPVDVSSLDVASMLHSAEQARSSLLHPEDDPSHYRSLILTKTLVGGVGFLTDAYMLFGLALAMVLAEVTHPQQAGDKALMTNAVFVGSIVGQIAFGIVADYIGRRKAFIATLSLLVAGALMSAGAFSVGSFRIYHALALSLFVLGLGIGGEYPLSATVSSEWATRDPWSRGRRIASVFSLQSFGAVLAPAVVCILLALSSDVNMVWRAAWAIGAVPGAIMLHFRYTMKETESYVKSHGHDVHHKDATAHKWRDIKAFWRQLLGVAGSWFIFDIVFYANGLFSSTILSQRYPQPDRSNPIAVHAQLLGIAQATLYLQLLSLPGYWLAAWLIDVVGRRALQIGSFAAMALTYSICGLSMPAMLRHPVLFYVLYGLTFTASQGANVVTYVLPSELFPTTIRASAHGLSAAVGKVGAALGGALMPWLLRRGLGLGSVMFVSAILSLLGLLWSLANTWETLGAPLPSSAHYHRQHTKEGVPLVVLELRMLNPKIFDEQPLSAFVAASDSGSASASSGSTSVSGRGLGIPQLARAVSAPLPSRRPEEPLEARSQPADVHIQT